MARNARAADSDETTQRIDKWLWHTRFYKTRTLASEAVRGGHVRLNGETARPSRSVRVGDWLDISRSQQLYRIRVLALPPRRGPAPEAADCYEEDPEARARREAEIERIRLDRKLAPGTPGRPDRRTQRKLRQIKQQ